jgi:DNA-binding HxlR family transcriptional regulator
LACWAIRANPEVPPRVEYRMTEFGLQFFDILDRIGALEHSHRVR